MPKEDVLEIINFEVEQRLGNMLRNFPAQDVGKKESDYRAQVLSLCEAVVEEQKHPDSELSDDIGVVASMVVDLLSLGDVVALQRGAAQLDTFIKADNAGPVVAFFAKHKVGQSLSQASAEVMVQGAARVNLDKAMQEATCALEAVMETNVAGEEVLSGVIAVFVQKAKNVSQEIAEMKKQGAHTSRATMKAGNDLDEMKTKFWVWLNKALKAEFLNTLCGVLESSAAWLTAARNGSDKAEFAMGDLQVVLQNDEILKHSLWKGLAAEMEKEKKILKLFDFYKSLAEQALNLVQFVFARNSETQSVFQGAALPPKLPPETLRKLKTFPDLLQQLADPATSSDCIREWANLIREVDDELAKQQNAGFESLGLLVEHFLDSKPEASKAKLEEVKRMLPQKCEVRPQLDAATQAGFSNQPEYN